MIVEYDTQMVWYVYVLYKTCKGLILHGISLVISSNRGIRRKQVVFILLYVNIISSIMDYIRLGDNS